MESDARKKFIEFIPHLRHGFETAKREGVPKFAVIAVRADGGGRVVAQFNGDEFLADLCGLLGVSVENTEEERMDAAAAFIVSMFGPVKNTADEVTT